MLIMIDSYDRVGSSSGRFGSNDDMVLVLMMTDSVLVMLRFWF